MSEMTMDLVVNPRNDQAAVDGMIRFLRDAQRKDVDEIEAATAALTADNYKSNTKSAFDKTEKEISAKGKGFVQAILAETMADKIVVQLTAYQSAVRNANKAYKAKWDEIKTASGPALPKHTYFYAITATDDDHLKLQKEIAKFDPGFASVSPQKDAEWRTAAKLFGINDNKKGE